MSRPVSLSVHRNNRARRHAKELRDEINTCIVDAQKTFGVELYGYSLVTWNEKGYALAHWNGAEALGSCPVEEYTKNIIARARGKRDATDIIYPDDDGVA